MKSKHSAKKKANNAKENGSNTFFQSNNNENAFFSPSLATKRNEHLPEDLQTKMEDSFGQDFSNVEIIKNSIQAKEINAQAFTQGNSVHFASGKFNPNSQSGKELIGHELTHVVQQRNGRVNNSYQAKSLNINDESTLEKEADLLGSKAAKGESVKDKISPLSTSSESNLIQRNSNRILNAVIQKNSDWTRSEVRTIQRELRRLGLYNLSIDGIFGDGTRSGLVEAFGGDAWQTMDVLNIISDLQGATPVAGTRGEHNLQYGEMFKDGILDFTIGIGYDETNAHLSQITAIENQILARGFSEPSNIFQLIRAVQLYQQAGRSYPLGERVYIKENALTYHPPIGNPRQVHAIIHLITSPNGTQGKEAAQDFQEGMIESDVSLYGGHGRYGTGPDFDRNMTFDLLDENGIVTRTIDDYHVLESELESESTSRTAWQQFLWRNRNNRITVHGSNSGNIYLNNRNPHSSEFGANLMYWNMQHNNPNLATGSTGSLNTDIAANPERRYRLWVFDGCRTQDYRRSIRATPNIDTRSTDMMLSRRALYWSDIASTLIASIDAVINQRTAEQIITDMDAANTTLNADLSRRSFRADGITDNPIIR